MKSTKQNIQTTESIISKAMNENRNNVPKIFFMSILIGISCFLTYFFYQVLKTDIVFSQFFYFPTIFSCVWWKKKGLIVVIFLCLLLIISHIFFNGLTMEITNTLVRASLLFIVGITVWILSEKSAQAEKNLTEYAINLEKMVEERTSEISNLQLYNRGLIETSPDPLSIIDKEGIILDCNKALVDLTGIKREELVGTYAPDYFTDPKRAHKGITTIIQEGKVRDFELTLNTKNGSAIISFNGSVYKDQNGETVGAVFIGRDITERKKIEDALQQSHNELEHALSELTKSQAKVLHTEKMASIGQLSSGIAHEINNPTGFISSNLKTLGDYIKDINAIFKEYSKLVSLINENISPEQDTAALLNQVSRITALEKEADIDFILSDISDLTKESIEGTERIKNIVSELKNFAHPGNQSLTYVNINKNIESTLKIVWNELKYKAKVIKDLGDIPQINCYPQQLNQVFTNLLINAAQAIENQGEIKISTRVHKNNDYFSLIEYENEDGTLIKYQPDEYVEITISDTGKGIPEENLSKIFDPFFTTKEVGKGTGLGLHIVYDIIHKHNGTIDVQSTVNKGTTFIIRLPV